MLDKLKKNCCPETLATYGPLILRIVVGLIFTYHGWGKWQDIDMTAGFFGNLGIPFATFSAYLVATVELVGGLMVLLGIYAKEAAKFLAVTMLVAIFTAHRSGPWPKLEFPLVLLGACLTIAGLGAGKYRLVKKECCRE